MNTFNDPIAFSKAAFSFLEADFQTFRQLLNTPSRPSNLAVGMVATACSGLDLYAWLLYSETRVTKRFKLLLADPRAFFSGSPDFTHSLVYEIVRCGVVHQFYPKRFYPLIAFESPCTLVRVSGVESINAFGFLYSSLVGLRKVQSDIEATTDAGTIQAIADRIARRMAADSSQIASSPTYIWPEFSFETTATATTPPPAPYSKSSEK